MPTQQAELEMLARAQRAEGFVRGLIGLTEMLARRDDVPEEVKEILRTNHRVVDARALIHEKADRHELASLLHNLDRVEHSLRDISAEIAGLRARLETLEESCREQIEQWRQDNSQFGVGA